MSLHPISIALMLALLVLGGTAEAGNDLNAVGGRSASLAHASSPLSGPFSTFYNPAGLARLEQISLAAYSQNRFLLEDLNHHSVAAALPTKSGTFGIGVSYYGFELYNEAKGSLAYGRKLAQNLTLGAQFDFYQISQADFDSKSVMTFGIGAQYRPVKDITIGAHLYNPINAKVTDYTVDNLPTIIQLGISYEVIPNVLVITEAEKNIDEKVIIKAAVEYHPVPALFVRGGIASNPGIMVLGAGIQLKKFRIDVGGSYHSYLGYSPHASLTFGHLLPFKSKDEQPQ